MKSLLDILNDDFNDHELADCQRLLIEQKDNPEVDGQLESFFNGLESEYPVNKGNLDKQYARLLGRLGITGKWKFHKALSQSVLWGSRMAAILAIPLMVAVGMLLASRKSPAEWTEITVPNGQVREVLLSDGSSMILNSGSSLIYPSEFQGKERKVFLDGEVAAEIGKDPDMPFIIQSGDQRVVVHGTKFDFKSYSSSECVELLLKEGSVSFGYTSEGGERLIRLSPGEMLQLDRVNGKLEIDRFSVENYKSFPDNRALHFNNLKFSDIAEDLERIFNVKIVIEDEKLANTRYLAFFTNHESLDQILKAISDNNRNMVVARRDGVIYLSVKR